MLQENRRLSQCTMGGNFDAPTHIFACSTVLTCGTMMACAPESKLREIHSAAQVGTTTIGVILSLSRQLNAISLHSSISTGDMKKRNQPHVQARNRNVLHCLHAHCHMLQIHQHRRISCSFRYQRHLSRESDAHAKGMSESIFIHEPLDEIWAAYFAGSRNLFCVRSHFRKLLFCQSIMKLGKLVKSSEYAVECKVITTV